uniref:Uncharacterized protein n=1 Tax=Heterorhabditis bacteriophora TaxID=37862 RepID=A0A1I7WRH3_HETBA
MGATDVLPYPRRRSSIHLEPLDIRLPGEPIEDSVPVKTFVVSKHPHTSSIRDSPTTIPKILKPIRDPPRRSLSPDTINIFSLNYKDTFNIFVINYHLNAT